MPSDTQREDNANIHICTTAVIEIKWRDEKAEAGFEYGTGSSVTGAPHYLSWTPECAQTRELSLSASEPQSTVCSYDTATLWGSENRLGDCCKKENNRKRRLKAWSAWLRVQKEGSPQIKLTTLLVSKEWLFLTLCTAGSLGSGNCNNFLFSSTLLIPGLVTNRVAERKSGERGRSTQQFPSLKRSVQMAFFAQLSFAVKTAGVQWNMVVWAKCLRDKSGCLQESETSI